MRPPRAPAPGGSSGALFVAASLVVSVLLVFVVAAAVAARAGDESDEWDALAPGMDLRVLVARTPSEVGDSRVTVLRIDPEHWDLELAGASLAGETVTVGRSARRWCERSGLAACTNAGMFATDHSTHVGYLRFREHTNSGRVNDYQSVAAFDPRTDAGDDRALPRFRIFDLDAPGVTLAEILDHYASAVQNLRLVKRPGSNRWSQQAKRWSEAALGEDAAGRILFLFSRSPFSMHDLVRELLAADIDLVAAQHLEGGPEAQLYIGVGEELREMFGSYETAFREDDTNDRPWPIPNVLGVRPRSATARAALAGRAPPSPPHR